jgi:hypothetical protein
VGMAGKALTVGASLSQWDISADGKHWYFMRDYNYPPRSGPVVDPSGTLVVADFPGAGNPDTLGTQIGSYIALDQGGTDHGVALLDHLAGGKGTYKLIGDLAKPTTVVTLATDVSSALVSPDLRFSLLTTQYDAANGTTDAVIIKNDGTGRCALASGPTTDLFGGAFLAHGGRVFWADHLDPKTGAAEGWLANPDGCADKQKFGEEVDFWFLAGDDGLVFSDTPTTSSSNLRFAKLAAGAQLPAGGPSTIKEGVGRVYAPLGADRDYVIFQIATGGADDGIYAYGPIGFHRP